MNIDFSEYEPIQSDGNRLLISGLSIQDALKVIMLNYKDEYLAELISYIRFCKEKDIGISTIHFDNGCNLLEMAIFRTDKKAVNAILQYTNLPITNTRARPWKRPSNRKAPEITTAACSTIDPLCVNALVNAIRFADINLLVELESRLEPGVPKLKDAIIFAGDTPICFALQRRHTRPFFEQLTNKLSSTLNMPCMDGFSPFMRAIELGYEPEYEIKLIVKKRCDLDKQCLRDLICDSNNNRNINSVQLTQEVGHPKTLEYLLNKGGKDCLNFTRVHAQQKEVRATSTSFMLLIPIYFLVFVGIAYFLYRIFCIGRNRYESYARKRDRNYLVILDHYAKVKKYEPSSYIGPFNNPDLVSTNKCFISEYQQTVAGLPVSHELPQFVRAPLYDHAASASSLIKMDNFSNEEITFYIPGTASTTRNDKIDVMNAVHLAYALGTQVILVTHDLARPFNEILSQICNIIFEYHNKHPNISYSLVGYSSGAYYATLAIRILSDLGIKFNRLILFAPMLDVGAEFRKPNGGQLGRDHKCQLPKYFVGNDKLNVLRSKIGKNEFFVNDALARFYLVDNCFKSCINSMIDLRKFSPLWFDSSFFDQQIFRNTTIIVGEKDCFRIDSEIFFEKLSDAKCTVTKIVIPQMGHALIWQSIYPIYLAQEILAAENGDNSDGEFKAIIKKDRDLAKNQKIILYAHHEYRRIKLLPTEDCIKTIFNLERALASELLLNNPNITRGIVQPLVIDALQDPGFIKQLPKDPKFDRIRNDYNAYKKSSKKNDSKLMVLKTNLINHANDDQLKILSLYLNYAILRNSSNVGWWCHPRILNALSTILKINFFPFKIKKEKMVLCYKYRYENKLNSREVKLVYSDREASDNDEIKSDSAKYKFDTLEQLAGDSHKAPIASRVNSLKNLCARFNWMHHQDVLPEEFDELSIPLYSQYPKK